MSQEGKLTGRLSNYYVVDVRHPQRDKPAYIAECEDITHALQMTPDEFCEFKAIWRTAAARLGNGKPGRTQLDQAIYDAEKRVHYAERSLKHLKQAREDAKLDVSMAQQLAQLDLTKVRI